VQITNAMKACAEGKTLSEMDSHNLSNILISGSIWRLMRLSHWKRS